MVRVSKNTLGFATMPRPLMGHANTISSMSQQVFAPSMACNLFMGTDRTVIWGDGVTGASLPGSATPDSPQTHTIYGRIPGGQHTLKAGNYAGSVTITVTYDP